MRRFLIVPALAAMVIVTSTGIAHAQDGPTVTVEPSTGLSDGDTLTATVSGFPADGAFSAGQCVTPIVDFVQQCDVTNIVPVALDADGAATFEITVKTGPIGDGMCGEGEVQCVVAVGSLTEPESATADIYFGADGPADAPADDAPADDTAAEAPAEEAPAEEALPATGTSSTIAVALAGLTLIAGGFMLTTLQPRLATRRR